MVVTEVVAIGLYIAVLLVIGVLSKRRQQTAVDFMLGGRSLNFYLTAFSAHASDMSAWLFMGLPAVIFERGLFFSWFALGLVLFMLLNWLVVAPRVRVMTERYNSITFSSFFESRFHDTSGVIRLFTAMVSLMFYSVYISSGAVGIGSVIEQLFGLPYQLGVGIGIMLTVTYLLIGGYRTLAWIDCFQAIFLLMVILFVPCFIWKGVGGWPAIVEGMGQKGLRVALFPSLSWETCSRISFLLLSWGIGYFGQPHILTKFMGIDRARDLLKAMVVGISWQLVALGSSIFVGALAVPFFAGSEPIPAHLFILMVRELFPLFLSSVILCAVLAAILSTMDAQILVLASSLTEDFYKPLFHKEATSKDCLRVSRIAIGAIGLLSFCFAISIRNVFDLVQYGWSGLGASFGPLMLGSLFSKRMSRQAAWAGMLTGMVVVNCWFFWIDHDSALLAAFVASCAAIVLCSWKKPMPLQVESYRVS